MKRPFTMFLVAAALSLSTVAMAADADRYVAPGGLFSIDAHDAAAPLFRRGKEQSSSDLFLVEFPFVNSMGLALVYSRTVEWVKLEKPVDQSQFDGQASALAEGFLEGRYGAGKFTIQDRSKFRSADGQLVYAFAARGELDQMPAQWQGVVRFFDTGIALVGEVVAQPTADRFSPKGGIVSQPAVDWAETLKPGA
jgi:hypothetical protein